MNINYYIKKVVIVRKFKNAYLLTLLISTLSASGFTTNSIAPGDTLIISSNAIPIGSFVNGIELYFDNTNTVAKGQYGYYIDYDDYAITNNAIVLEDWYVQMDFTSLPPVYNIGPAELYPVNLGPVLATFPMEKINKSTGFNMKLNPNWSSSRGNGSKCSCNKRSSILPVWKLILSFKRPKIALNDAISCDGIHSPIVYLTAL